MKGQGTIIIATLFTSIFLLSIIPLTLYVYNETMNRTPIYENPVHKISQISMKSISRDIVAFFNTSDLALEITNIGGEDVDIETIVLSTICGNNSVHINTKVKTTIGSGQTVSLKTSIDQNICPNPEPKTLHIITREGAIISPTVISSRDLELIARPTPNATTPPTITKSINILPIKIERGDPIWNISLLTQKGFEIYTLNNIDRPTRLQSYTDFLSRGMIGGTTTAYIWRLDRTATNTTIGISGQVVRNLWLGYDPRDPTRYNILITADTADTTTNRITITLGGTSISYSNTRIRIKIYGFRPSTPQQGILQINSTWIKAPSQDVADYTFLTVVYSTIVRSRTTLTLSGVAERVEIYTRTTGSGTGYNPYIMFMNTDGGRGFAGVLFTTIDRIWGFHTSRNEDRDELLDYSATPLVLVYKGYTVSNEECSAIAIAINYRFHDNEGADAQGVSVDRPVMFVGLVDENNNIYTYRSYTFRELTRYEDTYPPTAQAQSSIFFAPLPPSEAGVKRFYVFVAIQDPYHYSGNLDDLDFTLYIESIALIPLS